MSIFALAVSLSTAMLISTTVFASQMDDRIESSAKQTYVFRTYLKNDDIKVQSKAGDVVLTGTVKEESHKALARDTVASMPGVKSVDSQLALKGEESPAGSDSWLITKVKFTLLFHKNVNATGTKVFAKNGVVTLRGKATSIAQKDLTTEFVSDIEGVKSVRNKMSVPLVGQLKDVNPKGKRTDAVVESVDDASITALVKATLLDHRSTSALNATVETKDGVVSLGGTAKNAAEKDLAEKLVEDVHGVVNVVNNITVG